MADRVARVLIDSALPQLDHLFDYRVPAEFAETARPGVRVRVPLRSAGRIADGYLVEYDDESEFDGKLSAIDSVVSAVPVLSAAVWKLARAVADRNAGNASDVIRLAVPPRQVRVEKAFVASQSGDAEQWGSVAPVGGLPPKPTTAIRGYAPAAIEASIAARARIAVRAIPRVTELSSGEWVGEWAVTLAMAAINTLAGGASAILVVPDYRDQQQLAAALTVLAPSGSVAPLDARQSNAERYRAFLSALAGPRIIIGNRSAVYAPAEELGLIAVWDDGDPLHVEPLAPYVHTRDAALVRQQQQGCSLIFAGATRSVEVQRLVDIGWLTDVAPVPTVTPRVIPTLHQASGEGFAASARIPSTAWNEARSALERGPVLVQVARPGYIPMLACRNCSQPARCTNCTGPLRRTSAGAVPSCEWCGLIATAWVCSHCEHTELRTVTIGAGRTAEELGRAFPGVTVLVSDGEHPRLAVGAEPALVIATRGAEPIAARGYQAILLLDGERMLARESLGVADDCLRWWSNAAALSAHGATTMLVGVGGELARCLATWQQPEYARRELAERRQLHLPPAVRLATVTGAAEAVESAVAEVDPQLILDALGPATIGDGQVRTILRFDYAKAPAAAAALRAAVVRNATSRRRSPAQKGGYRRAPTLKVRFDDPEIL